ncbi:LON peptidase substrate-binding domain-containing protein [Paracoccus salipaludis]|uniref:ATP-dependent protease n=1 Tax=Paracoccus salipaludis TaxID=2032623 RepID=A0A2A2GLN7_9RHOB|nr:LON peptidase substrate-binding domain-containing protein [Paracoccus salipaludis]PAU97775.1 ATP-dependent protease [Paracoccus salipaludis]
MTPRGALPDTIPLFPLPGAVLLPRTRLPLHIFEPRYLQMLDDALKSGHRLIGMIQPIGDGLAAVGTAGRVTMFSEMDDGRLMISLRAISRFRLEEVIEGFTPYLRGRVDWSPFKADRAPSVPPDQDFDRPAFLERLQRYMDERELSTDWNAAEEADDELLVNSLSMLLPLGVEEKQALLEAADLPARREMLDGLLEYALHGGGDDEEMLH